MKTDYDDLVLSVAAARGLDAVWLKAQMLEESSGHADAFRFEAGFYASYLAGKPEWAGQVPRRISSSYGLLQIMFPVAKELGYGGEPEGLFVPHVGLDFGAHKMQQLLAWANGDIEQALAAYNGGKGGNAQRPFRNQGYTDRVKAIRAKL